MSPNSTPNLTLDPQGFRGTSTARRARQSRQRRRLRALMFALLLLAGAGGLVWLGMQPRATSFTVVSARQLPLDLSEPATLNGNGKLWLTSQSGALWEIGLDGESRGYNYLKMSRAGAPPLVSASGVDVGGVYVPGLDGTLWRFDGGDKILWKRDLGAALATTPAQLNVGNLRILGAGNSDGRVFGLSAIEDGKTLWSAQLGGPIGNALTTTRDGFVAPTLANGVWRGGLVCLDGKSGRIRWRYPQNGKLSGGVATARFDASSNRIYWNNDESSVVSLDASSGRVLWETAVARADAPRSVMLRAQPVLWGQSLIVGGNDGILRSLDANNGKARWTVDLGSPIRVLSAANVAGRPAVLAVSEGEIALIDAATGQIIGRDQGAMAWPMADGKGAVIVGEAGNWRRVRW